MVSDEAQDPGSWGGLKQGFQFERDQKRAILSIKVRLYHQQQKSNVNNNLVMMVMRLAWIAHD